MNFITAMQIQREGGGGMEQKDEAEGITVRGDLHSLLADAADAPCEKSKISRMTVSTALNEIWSRCGGASCEAC